MLPSTPPAALQWSRHTRPTEVPIDLLTLKAQAEALWDEGVRKKPTKIESKSLRTYPKALVVVCVHTHSWSSLLMLLLLLLLL